MGQKNAELTAKQERAALLAAEDEISDDEIAAQCGIARSTLARWKDLPEFQARVRAHVDELGRALARYHIARRDKRMALLQERNNRLHQIVAERAEDPDMEDVPGGQTGYLVRTFKIVPQGDDNPAKIIPEYSVDTGLVSALNTVEKQAAQEAGQWANKHEVEHSGSLELLMQALTTPHTVVVPEPPADLSDFE